MEDKDYKCSLDEATLAKAKKQLNEDPSTRLLEVKNLREKIQKVSGLRAKTDVATLLCFLRARKFDQERASKLIQDYYKVRTDREFFTHMKPSKLKHVFESKIYEVLKERSNDGCRVLILRIAHWDVDAFPVIDIMRTSLIMMTYLAREEATQVNGIHLIENLEGISWKQATATSPSTQKKWMHMIQDALPMRFSKLDITHEPTFFDAIFAIMKPFMKKKLLDRMDLHGSNFDKIRTIMDPAFLPSDLGGELEPHSNKEFWDELLQCDSMFEEELKYGYTNMSVTSDNDRLSADAGMSGLGGTFKKLDI